MFVNRLNSALKKTYKRLNPELKDKIFPNGLDEFLFVGNVLNNKFQNKNKNKLLQIYGATYAYYITSHSNIQKTFEYVNSTHKDFLSKNEIISLLSLVSMNSSLASADNQLPNEPLLLTHKIDVEKQIDIYYTNIKNKIFTTKKEHVGTQSNPILVNGISGIHKYIESIDFHNISHIEYKRTKSVYLTHIDTDISFAIDEYTIIDANSKNVIVKLWFNLYGSESCKLPPDGYSFK